MINNYDFQSKMPNRDFSGFDRDALFSAFRHIGYKEIEVCENLTSTEMQRLAEHIAQADYEEYGNMVLIVLTHGDEDNLYGVDGEKIAYKRLLHPIKNSSKLKRIPKFYIAQACNPTVNAVHPVATEVFNGVQPTVSNLVQNLAEDAAKCAPDRHCTTYPQSDMLIAYSFIPGTPNGSRFIQAFAEVLRIDGRRLGVTKMLTRAMRLMSYTPGTTMPNKSLPSPVVISQLTSEFYLA
ncbi:caspase-3-like isoform X2 [Watersipora subatra]